MCTPRSVTLPHSIPRHFEIGAGYEATYRKAVILFHKDSICRLPLREEQSYTSIEKDIAEAVNPFLLVPALLPPMESRVPSLYGPTITLVVLATLAVALRFTARKLSGSRYWWDDWILVLALVSLTVDRCLRAKPLNNIQFFDYGLSLSYWLQSIYGGLGHHTTAHGGPVGEGHVVTYYKVYLLIGRREMQ